MKSPRKIKKGSMDRVLHIKRLETEGTREEMKKEQSGRAPGVAQVVEHPTLIQTRILRSGSSKPMLV